MTFLDELDQLKSEQAAVVAPIVTVTEEFKEALATLKAMPLGRPKLTGKAAVWAAMANGQPPPNEYPGSGQLAAVVCNTPDEFVAVVRELVSTQPVAVLPPDAPESKPIPAEAPTVAEPVVVADSVKTPVAEEKRPRGRPKKLEPSSSQTTTAPPAAIIETTAVEVPEPAPAPVKRQLFIGCEPSIECALLRPYIVAYAKASKQTESEAAKNLSKANLPGGAYFIGVQNLLDIEHAAFDLVVVPS